MRKLYLLCFFSGRPPFHRRPLWAASCIALSDAKKALAIKLYKAKELTVQEVCEAVGISKPTLYKYVKEAKTMNK